MWVSLKYVFVLNIKSLILIILNPVLKYIPHWVIQADDKLTGLENKDMRHIYSIEYDCLFIFSPSDLLEGGIYCIKQQINFLTSMFKARNINKRKDLDPTSEWLQFTIVQQFHLCEADYHNFKPDRMYVYVLCDSFQTKPECISMLMIFTLRCW